METGFLPAKKQVTDKDLKKERKVRFNPFVHRIRLPEDEAEVAQFARKSHIVEAPYHDELWDGDLYAFREKELTSDELWAINFKSKVTSLPYRLARPLKKSLRALRDLLPTTDLISAHASKLNETPEQHRKVAQQLKMYDKLPEPFYDTSVKSVVNCQVFERYDTLLKSIENHKSAPEDLKAEELRIATLRLELVNVKEEVRRIRFELPEIERRISKNTNPRSIQQRHFSYVEKNKQLEQEYEGLKMKKEEGQKKTETLAIEIHEGIQRLNLLGERLCLLRGAESEKNVIEDLVISVFGKDDTLLTRTMEALDDVKSKIDKQRYSSKKLQNAVYALKEKVLYNGFLKSQEALLEVHQLVSSSLRAVSSGYITSSNSSSSSTILRSLLLQSETPRPSSDTSLLAVRRREISLKAREFAFKGLEILENTLDDLEEYFKDIWNPIVFSWRKEIPKLHSPDLFGVLRKTEERINSLPEQLQAQLKQKFERKLAAINILIDLTHRYISYFELEESRSLSKVTALLKDRNELEKELQQKRKVVFNFARSKVMGDHQQPSFSSADVISAEVVSPSSKQDIETMSVDFPYEEEETGRSFQLEEEEAGRSFQLGEEETEKKASLDDETMSSISFNMNDS